jgi:hypothetical protein
MFCTVDSKSKSKPSMTVCPNGRGEELPVSGPKILQRLVAAVTAAADDEKPPSVYVEPPTERRIVFP